MMTGEDFDRQVYDIVAAIPRGKVMTYGQIALMLGSPNHSRRVGRALRNAPEGLPCQRVVNAQGRPSPGWPEQAQLLKDEGVSFKESGLVDLAKCAWWNK